MGWGEGGRLGKSSGLSKYERLGEKVVFALTLTLSPRRGDVWAKPSPPTTRAQFTPFSLRERAGVRGSAWQSGRGEEVWIRPHPNPLPQERGYAC